MTEEILKKQKEYFRSGATLPLRARDDALSRLYSAIKKYEPKIVKALYSDLGKSEYESFMCEIGLCLSEITYMRKHLRRFAGKKRVHTPLAQFSSKSYTLRSPYGSVLILSPWNYPFLLSIEPLADALAAGNTVVLKPSAYSPETSAVIAEMAAEIFDPRLVSVVTGGRRENADLLAGAFDLVFFTGSQAVGREVLRCCAERLAPAVLELGGKSPCIVDETADIPLAARRIVFGKFLNCGQTCVAPDYILCRREIKDRLCEAIRSEIIRQFGERPLENPDYGKIVNEKHFSRISGLIDQKKLFFGGKSDSASLKIEPTMLCDVEDSDPVMQEEIFGPVLPVLCYDKEDEIFSFLADKQSPLALYVFSRNRGFINALQSRIKFGGGCVNDVVIHLATSEMPFGGVGESGMGAYHGKRGFEAFSHEKSIVDKQNWIDLPMRYQPYNRGLYGKLLRMFLK